MILTTCWVCAAPLDQNWLGKCVRCDTRYCSQDCLRQHPDEECRSISRGGGAEQYHADKKYKEAVAVAVEACADGGQREGAREIFARGRSLEVEAEDEASIKLDGRTHFGFG